MPAYSNPQAYERWMVRWSVRLAPLFVRFAGLESPGRYLDVGAGTGVLARAIADEFGDAEVVGIEPVASYVDHARARLRDPRFRFELGDAQAIPFNNDSFDAALALLILQEVPDAPMAVGEMRRVTRSGGCLAASQWDFRRGMPMLSLFWEAVQEVIPGERTRREAARRVSPDYSDEGALARLWEMAGLARVETAGLEIAMDFASFDDYWSPFLGGATLTSSYAATLPDDVRQRLAARLREKVLGDGPDRPFSLSARAWAVRGIVP
jgi:SAM-dependent methyltransferase